MKFTKMQGCGNDYVYVDCFAERVAEPSALARRVADRHYGVGGDGLILIEPSERADAFMHMFNADGSEGAMCGTGVRCVAKYLYDHGLVPKERCSVRVDTRAGVREIYFRVWERGSGETLACGTGAAAVYAGIRMGRLDHEVLAHLAGGDLTLRYEPNGGHILLTGEAVEVFSGEYPIAISYNNSELKL